MNKYILAAVLCGFVGAAHAQSAGLTNGITSSTASQSASQNLGQGNGNSLTLNSAPSPDRYSETIRNVSAGVLGAFASSANPFNCTYTKAGGNIAVPGASGTFQWSTNDVQYCVAGWMQAELNRQSTITKDEKTAEKLQQASLNVKCGISDQFYDAMVAAGLQCDVKPEDYEKRHPVPVAAAAPKVAVLNGRTVYAVADTH